PAHCEVPDRVPRHGLVVGPNAHVGIVVCAHGCDADVGYPATVVARGEDDAVAEAAYVDVVNRDSLGQRAVDRASRESDAGRAEAVAAARWWPAAVARADDVEVRHDHASAVCHPDPVGARWGEDGGAPPAV